ncbi:MAG TPA: MgtC/SapB family protein [Gemmatimonadaceae bacterium]|nr:MgtC/SapB family protein [Gemmatimonadaceae bacterium]
MFSIDRLMAIEILEIHLLGKLLLAVVLGGAIGLERELKGKPAGLRTNILICMGAALLTDVSISISLMGATRIGDPARLAAQIVSGVGFLGAGTIMQSSGTVTGLTSAATIWVVAAIGIAVGSGNYVGAAGAGALVTVVLAWLGRVEHRIKRFRRVMHLTVRAKPGTPLESIVQTLQEEGIRVTESRVFDHPRDRTFELTLSGPAVQFEIMPQRLMERGDVTSVSSPS